MNKRWAAFAAPFVIFAALVAGCGTGNDTKVDTRDKGSAKAIMNMPDHFNNVAIKCFEGNGVYVTNNLGDAGTGTSLAVVASDPICK